MGEKAWTGSPEDLYSLKEAVMELLEKRDRITQARLFRLISEDIFVARLTEYADRFRGEQAALVY